MKICLRYSRVFWMVAMFLMAAGQVSHAAEDLRCDKPHAAETQKSDEHGCPVEHTCCCGHLHGKYASDHEALTLIIDPRLTSVVETNEVPVEGPVLEIDYPPQLS